jgi:hypothetical protein
MKISKLINHLKDYVLKWPRYYGIIKCYTDGTIPLLLVFEAQFSMYTNTNAMLRSELLLRDEVGPYGKLLGRCICFLAPPHIYRC